MPEDASDQNDARQRVQELRLRHQALMARNLDSPLPAAELEAFQRELMARGETVQAGRERNQLRNMLFFWSAELSNRNRTSEQELIVQQEIPAREASAREGAAQETPAQETPTQETPAKTQDTLRLTLDPYQGSGLPSLADRAPEAPLRPSSISDRQLSDSEFQELVVARTTLRIAALARQYKASSKQSRVGYLLNGSALQEAERVMQRDPDILLLVEDSRRKVEKDKWSFRAFLAVLVGLIGVTAWFFHEQQIAKRDQELAAANSLQAQAAVQISRLETALKDLQEGKIEALQNLAKEANISKTELNKAINAPRVNSPETPAASRKRPPVIDVGGNPTSANSCSAALWLGSEKDRKITGSDPLSQLKVGTRVRVDANDDLRLREELPTNDYTLADAIGLISVKSEIVIASTPKGYERPNGLTQYWALVKTARPFCVRVFLQYSGSVAGKLDALRDTLVSRGFYLPAPEQTEKAAGKAEVRYFRPSDEKAAKEVAKDVNKLTGGAGVKVQMLAEISPRPDPGTIEVWLDLAAKPE